MSSPLCGCGVPEASSYTDIERTALTPGSQAERLPDSDQGYQAGDYEEGAHAA